VDGANDDPLPANDSSSAIVTATPAVFSSDLTIVKTGPDEPVFTSSPVDYTITVTNSGPDAATSVVVTDELPPGTTLSSVSTNVVDSVCTGTSTIVCTVPEIGANAAFSVFLRVISPARTGPFTNTASVSSANADPDPSDNASSVTLTAAASAGIPTLSGAALLAALVLLAAAALLALR
jgi:uncharacterized repeat protein (TIGR01451 family)